MITQEQVITALTEVYWGVEGSREKDYAYDTVDAFVNEHPDAEPKKPTQFDLMLFLYNNTPYTWEEIGQAFNIRVTVQ